MYPLPTQLYSRACRLSIFSYRPKEVSGRKDAFSRPLQKHVSALRQGPVVSNARKGKCACYPFDSRSRSAAQGPYLDFVWTSAKISRF